ncbi:glycosyltransferase [Natrialbaceae archaeon A-gly3]
MSAEESSNSETGHIAFYLPSLRGGGAEKVMVNLATEFANRGHTVDMVLVQARGEYIDDVPKEVNIVDLETRRFLAALPSLTRYLRRERPDAMLSTIDTANVTAICAKRAAGVSTRVVIRISNMLSTKEANGELKHRLVHRTAKYVYPYADEIVAVSDGVGEDLLKMTNASPEQITTIYNPSVTEELLEKRSEPVDHPWFGEDEEIPVILGVGELSEQKDFETLIRAFDRVIKSQQARLVILGEGPRREKLETLVTELGLDDIVSMPGFVDNPYAYMAKTDVFVLSSRWEGCPNVLVEAMACGSPVVSTDCPSGPEEILKDGRHGLLVPVGDEEQMARCVINVLSREEMERSARYAQARFSVREISREYIDVVTLE